ncbi:GNAT family N-acetyltransferase, partial [Staphylococcus hominis]|nr:GNAT family N-acetyltransferase [Staphylococcus hominis]
MLENLFLKDKKDEITLQNLICEVINYAKSRHIEKLM